MSSVGRNLARQRGHFARSARETAGRATCSPMTRNSDSVEPGVRLRLSRVSNQNDWHGWHRSMAICRPWCASSFCSTMAAPHCGHSTQGPRTDQALSTQHQVLRLVRRLYLQNYCIRFVGGDIQQTVTPLLDVANPAAQVAEQRLATQLFVVLVNQDSIEPAGAGNLPVAHAADEDVALPLGQTIAGIEGDARHGNRGHPVDDRVADSFLRERPLPRTAVGAAEADERPAVVGAGHEDVDLVSAVWSVLDLPDGAGDRVPGHSQEGAMAHREDFWPRVGAADERIVRRNLAFVREPKDLAAEGLGILSVAAAVRHIQHAVAAEHDRTATAAFADEDVLRVGEPFAVPDG